MAYHGFNGEPFCFCCGRTAAKLGVKETITVDHIVELRDGGKDEINNTQLLCSACHRIKNWIITYFVKHFEQEASPIGVAPNE
jgi:5-methylcytosine-specific restriction endonuclease McrA